MELKLAGYVARTKGLQGDLLVNTMDIGMSMIKPGDNLFMGFSLQFAEKFICTKWNQDGKNFILHLQNINDIDSAAKFKENGVYYEPKELFDDEDDDDYTSEITGFDVYNAEDKSYIGKVKEILILPANDVMIVSTENGELPVPYIREFIKRISKKYKKVNIEVMEGLMDLIKK
jgi:16S rRNA processing protein RimM